MRELRADSILILGSALLATLLLLYVTPILAPEHVLTLGDHYAQLLLLIVVVASLHFGTGKIDHREERRYWRWLTAAFTFWIIADSMFEIFPTATDNMGLSLTCDCLHLFAFFGIAMAIEQKPHREPGWSSRSLTHQVSTIGSAVLIVGLLVYFVIIPAQLNAARYESIVPTMYLFVILDAFLAIRFLSLTFSCGIRRWRFLYGLVGLASVCWFLGDLADMLYYLDIFKVETGTLLDFIFYVPLWLIILSGRARDFIPRESHPQRMGRRNIDHERVVVTGLLSIYAILFPVIHFGGYTLGLLDISLQIARSIVVLAILLILIALAVSQQILFERQYRRLESKVTVLAMNEQLVHSQKMEAIGRLAGGVAHEFNNLLLVIRGYAEFLQNGIDKSDPRRENVDHIQGAVDRASSLTRQLLTFGRKEEFKLRTVDLNVEIEQIEKMLRMLIGEDIEFVTDLDPQLDCISADSGQIAQVVLNLVINARAAMPYGGKLEIRTENMNVTEPVIHRDCTITPGEYIVLTVRDNGEGISVESQSRVFEPFYTTKRQGTGLGLSTVWSIVKQGNGHTCLQSELGKGSTFRIFFPRVDADATSRSDLINEREPEVERGLETILLVEDEDSVRDLLKICLHGSGYRILEAPDGAQAIQIAELHEGTIDLLLTDVVMPGVSGPELARKIIQARPNVNILYMSGYTNDTSFHKVDLRDGEGFLQKPFSLDELRKKVRETLRQSMPA